MTRLSEKEAVAAAAEVSGWGGPFAVKDDTSEFFDIQASDVIRLDGGEYFLIRGEAREPRFGLEGEPKWWVKRAQELPSGRRVIIKLVFLESFDAKIGPLTFRCYRSPEKEARILKKVDGHPGFMQGRSARDAVGNSVRILEIVPGPTLDQLVGGLNKDHEAYFTEHLPGLLAKYAQAVEDMAYLHAMGELHGDIRRDHLIHDRETGRLRWIDFDYTYDYGRANRFAYDLFGLGNILIFLVGGGTWTLSDLRRSGYNDVIERLSTDDMNIVFNNYLANMKKLFPYIPEELNRICLHFSGGAKLFYENVCQLLEDLDRVVGRM